MKQEIKEGDVIQVLDINSQWHGTVHVVNKLSVDGNPIVIIYVISYGDLVFDRMFFGYSQVKVVGKSEFTIRNEKDN